ncbi:cadmium-translocating P-type ATPase [Psychromonas sp. RZ22]|uniref:heavy metal translocating P-type ATPase n=1 Tax=Psychromonas algarum TaxID=2555643 RepID=UPI001067D810|nr:heavy metal translocating P-type ATPase [Psychromonas sp. RZ22]TEW53695.1 cadmium-translocating P-type ATPase [Psychromonas sp. RZ22]
MKEVSLCFHCGEPNPTNTIFKVVINDVQQNMCCPGCEAIAQTIVDSGLSSYYEHRTEVANKGEDLIPEELQQLKHYDLEQIQSDFIKKSGEITEITLTIEGISCAACAWLIEKQLRFLPGIMFVNVNTTLNRALIRWDNKQVALSKILQQIQRIGYKGYPFQVNQQEVFYTAQVKSYLRRLGLAGLATMQVMMFAIALYADFFSGMEEEFIHYFRWVSFIIATPVLLYSAQPFYANAWRNIRNKTLGMDIPISIALLGAYTASGYATIVGRGEVYFESVAMFTFLLLLGRLLELRARRKASETSSNLLRLLPSMATLIDVTNDVSTHQLIPAKTLVAGQKILVKPGETIAVDGKIIDGQSNIEESMLTGEHLPVFKQAQDSVYAGTVNISSVLTIEVVNVGNNTLIADIIQLQNNAQQNKPRIEVMADTVSRYFVAALLVIATLTYIGWSIIDADQAFWITLSVLVATCPCALSLATPTALTCATAQLNKQGILIKQHHVLETLNKIQHIVFDKTGTLTEGNFKLLKTHLYPKNSNQSYTEQQCIDIAANLEINSEHPIAVAFSQLQNQVLQLSNIENIPSQGLQASWRNNDTIQQIKLGHAKFCQVEQELESKELAIYLTVDEQLIAIFELGDEIRSTAAALTDFCQLKKLKTTMLTGDISNKSEEVAKQLNIETVIKGVNPQQKLTYIQELQQTQQVMMIGDGINDAPVLAGAHVSVALASGTDIAKNCADVILLGSHLQKISLLMNNAKKTTRIIRENLAWSLGYNLIIMPLAVMGLVPPYIAVLGMSFSSLIVVSNSLRLLK